MIPTIASTGSLEAYSTYVRQIPRLTESEEFALAHQYRDENNLDAAKKLILANLRFVMFIARSYRHHNLPMEDLIQEGNIGLMKAVKRFDPTAGVRLVSFAVSHIKHEIANYILRNGRIVKAVTTKALRKLFFNRSSWLKDHMNNKEISAVAEQYKVLVPEVRTIIEYCNGTDCIADGEESPLTYMASTIPDPSIIVETDDIESRRSAALKSAMDQLSDRSRDIIEQRWLTEGKVTLSDLSVKYGISIERVRQIENKALTELKKHVGEIF